jgi:hypothetical protein
MIGLAMRTCIDLGMHRKVYEQGLDDLTIDGRRRLFWTVYYLERMIAISLGRPLSILDRQIDVPLPETDKDRGGPRSPVTLATHLFLLRRIESRIYQSVYRADKPLTAVVRKLDPLFGDLESWRSALIADFHDASPAELNYPMLHYNRAVRLLIQPFLPLLSLSDRYHGLCLRAAGDICQAHKRLHQTIDYGHSFIAVQTVFVAGLTLLYSLWRWSQDAWTVALADDIRACSLVLFVMSERAPWVQRYRDAFELLISAAMAKLRAGHSSQKVDRPHTASSHPGGGGASTGRPEDKRGAGGGDLPQVHTGNDGFHSTFAQNPYMVPGKSTKGQTNDVDSTAWPIVAELAEWMEQDGDSPVLWMPDFERLQNLQDMDTTG